MPEFWMDFFANLAADTVLAIGLYIAITRPRERTSRRERARQALGLLRAELAMNAQRADKYVQTFAAGDPAAIRALFPLRYTRGAWNALKESGFLRELDNPRLVYRLLRANEATLVANTGLQKVRYAVVTDDPAGGALATKAAADSSHMLERLEWVLSLLDEMDLPEFGPEELSESP